MIHFINIQNLGIPDFIVDNPDLSILICGTVIVIVLIILFICLRIKMKKQAKILQDARIQEEKYRVLAEISNDILFEYDIFSDEMVYSDKYTENFGRKAKIERFAELKEEIQYVYKDDVFAFENFCKLLGGEKQKLEVEYRM